MVLPWLDKIAEEDSGFTYFSEGFDALALFLRKKSLN